MKYFKITELIRCYRESKAGRCEECRLNEAAKRLPNGIEENITELAQAVLDPAREALGKAVVVNSGFRCPIHNSHVGGASQSQHIKGQAADICVDHKGYASMREWREANLELARVIARQGKWDQMILENVGRNDLLPAWVHVSYNRFGQNRHEVRKKVAGQSGYPLLSKDEMNELLK